MEKKNIEVIAKPPVLPGDAGILPAFSKICGRDARVPRGFAITSIVSIWIGKFNSDDDFNKYKEEVYDENGDGSPSIFMTDFEIKRIDHDFLESEFVGGKLTKNDLMGFSYTETFIDKIDDALLTGNCIILIYDFEYSGGVKTKNNVSFIGTYKYEKNH